MQKYNVLKVIGGGNFGVVYKAIAPDHSIVAIKKMRDAKYYCEQDSLKVKQIKCLKRLRHENIVELKEVIISSNELYLVFNFLETNLYQMYTRAKESNRTLTEQEIRGIFFQVASALAHLHKSGFFHRDLKPENILCHHNHVQLCDFGLARQIRAKPPFTEYVATRWYRAPQILLHGGYNSPMDIFALGCIIVELYMMAPLFPGESELETMNRIVELLGTPKKNDWPEGYKLASTLNYNFPECKGKQLSDLIPDASIEVVELLQAMLSYSPRKRPSASEILKSEFFKSINCHEEKDQKNQTKFSFYENKIIDIPQNVPVEISAEMDMRKSQIKFGGAFTSSFHLAKKEGELKHETPVKSNQGSMKDVDSNKPFSFPESKSKQRVKVNQDQISKKFDQMEEILLELQMKREKEGKGKQQWVKSKPKLEQEKSKEDRPKQQWLKTKPDEEKMSVFSFGGIGTSSFSMLNSKKSKLVNK